MDWFSRNTTDELRAEAKQTEANIASATRLQAAFGSSGCTGEDNDIARYQRTLSQINEELKHRS